MRKAPSRRTIAQVAELCMGPAQLIVGVDYLSYPKIWDSNTKLQQSHPSPHKHEEWIEADDHQFHLGHCHYVSAHALQMKEFFRVPACFFEEI